MANHGLEQTAHRLRQDIRKEKRAFVSRSRVPPLIPTVLRKVSYDSYSPRQRRTLAVRCKRFGFSEKGLYLHEIQLPKTQGDVWRLTSLRQDRDDALG
jgi:hypothetical protein